MKTTLRRFLSLFTAAVLLLSFALPALAGTGAGSLPVVYVPGYGDPIYNSEGEQVYKMSVETGYITDAVKDCMPSFIKALTTDYWVEYCEKLYAVVFPIYEDLKLDENGENSNGSYVNNVWPNRAIANTAVNGEYGLFDYWVHYDWRLDPCENAAMLDGMIQNIKAVTGAPKVNLIGRCEGANIALAYLNAYGYDDVECLTLYSSAAKGVDAVGAAFSGKLRTDADALDRYADQSVSIEDPVLNELLFATIDMAQETYGLNLATGTVNLILKRMYKAVLPDLVLGTYGTMPGVWSFVGEDDYDEALAFIFHLQEDTYARLIEKIEHYHETVGSRTEEILTEARDNGVKIQILTKYDKQTIPLVYENDEQSDSFSSLDKTSFGATAAKIGETLDADYIEMAVQHNLGKYISPDSVVDASTCLFPDTTWFIKGLTHVWFPVCCDPIITGFFRSHGAMTVFDDAALPQYVVFDEPSVSIAPLEKTGEPDDTDSGNIFAVIRRFFQAILAFLRQYLNKTEV